MAKDAADRVDYRLAPAIGARLVGGLLVVLAVVLGLVTALTVALHLPPDVVVVTALVGVAAVLVAGHVITRRVGVVTFDADGYRVRLVRGAGVAAARWSEVTEVGTATPGGVPVVVVHLADGRATTIPVQVLAGDREEFVRDLRDHLQRGQGLRPLPGSDA
jgi:hypothetical protein